MSVTTPDMHNPPFVILRLAPDFENPGTGITLSTPQGSKICHEENEAITELTRLCDENPGITFILFVGIRMKMLPVKLVPKH